MVLCSWCLDHDRSDVDCTTLYKVDIREHGETPLIYIRETVSVSWLKL